MRHRGREVVSDAALVVEEFSGGYGTHGMASRVIWSGVAPPVPVEAGKRIAAAGLEAASKDIALGHGTSILVFHGSPLTVGDNETRTIAARDVRQTIDSGPPILLRICASRDQTSSMSGDARL